MLDFINSYNPDFVSMIVTLYQMCDVFVQCKAKPAKPCGSLEMDQARLAGLVGFEEQKER